MHRPLPQSRSSGHLPASTLDWWQDLPGLEMALHFWQIEVGALASGHTDLCTVEEVEPKVKERGAHDLAIHHHVALIQMPATGPGY